MYWQGIKKTTRTTRIGIIVLGRRTRAVLQIKNEDTNRDSTSPSPKGRNSEFVMQLRVKVLSVLVRLSTGQVTDFDRSTISRGKKQDSINKRLKFQSISLFECSCDDSSQVESEHVPNLYLFFYPVICDLQKTGVRIDDSRRENKKMLSCKCQCVLDIFPISIRVNVATIVLDKCISRIGLLADSIKMCSGCAHKISRITTLLGLCVDLNFDLSKPILR